MKEKIVLIDGHSILNRAFYGVPDFTNSQGIHTNAVYGFLNIMFKFLDEEKPSHLAVAFDLSAPTFRHKMYDAYKGTRKPMLPELKEQVPIIKEVLVAMNIEIMELEGFEADDILGTMSKKCEQNGLDVTVVSGDRDLLQLATKSVKISIPKTKKGSTTVENYYESDVEDVYGVTPTQFIDVKALMGDSSDNIPGVPGIGEKGATSIISEYSSIENAFDNVDNIKNARNREALRNNFELAKLSKVLATIDTNAPITTNINNCVIDEMFNKEAFEYIKKLEFKSMFAKFSNVKTENVCEDFFNTLVEFSDVENCFEKINKSENVGVYINRIDNDINGISVSFTDKDIYYIKTEGFITADYLMSKIQDMIKNQIPISVYNLKEYQDLLLATEKSDVFDAGIAAYLLNPLKETYEYDDIAKDYLDMQVPSYQELFPKTKKEIDSDQSENSIIKWMCYNAYILYKSREVLTQKLAETEMLELYRDIEWPLIFALYDMEQTGVKVEKDILASYSENLALSIDKLQNDIFSIVGHDFNINSPKQLGIILFEELGIPNGKKTKTGYSTSADVLDKLKDEYPIVSKILEYRQLTKLKSTYADGLSQYINEDGRIHGKFNQTITATGRISSTDPNLQNIPVRMELGRQIRKVFVPKDECIFIDADYSQIELRILAHMSGDENLIEAYKASSDIHQATASKVFNVPIDKVTKEQRSNAKAVNFGIVYGISSFGLSQDLSISRKEAEKYISDYFESYPKVKEFLDRTVEDAKTNGYTTTLFGRRRPIPELSSGNFMQRSFGERAAMNSPIQGTAADIMKIAALNVYRELKNRNLKSKIVLQVHDELLVEAYKDEIDEVKSILETNMKNAANLKVPFEIGMDTGVNWYEAH